VSFEGLERNPVEEMQKLYENLNLAGFHAFRPKLQVYVESLSGYRRNEFGELDSSLRVKIARAWQRSFDEWHYPL